MGSSGEQNRGKKIGWERRSSKVRKRGQEIGISKILQMNSYFWKEGEWENADKKEKRDA